MRVSSKGGGKSRGIHEEEDGQDVKGRHHFFRHSGGVVVVMKEEVN